MREEKHNRHLRIIYTRVLERGLSKCVSYLLKEENDNKEKFLSFIDTIKKPILKATKVSLDNEYYNLLEKLVFSILELKDKEFELEDIRANIIRNANALQKIQRKRNNTKDKHKKKKFEDGY
jgi:hypothetical protein